ncbi:MAG: arginine deiminase family protein [Bacillota bacterium]|nr:arginine deiminase family protein [Bacillota bacterium]
MEYGCQSMVGKIDSILIKRPEQAFISQQHLDGQWRAYNYLGCPDYERTVREHAAFEEILKSHVKHIYALPADSGVGLDSIYTHDPLKITVRGAIYFPMGKQLRSGERIASEKYLLELGIPTLGHILPPGKMEGGDVLWINEKTVAIGQGYRTNAEGIRQFTELTRDFIDEYIIVPMPHGDGEDCCLHLMSVISFVDTDKAVVYSKFMPVFFRQYLLEHGYTLIECDDDEYERLGSNVLCLAPGVCVMMAGNPKMEARLRAAGIELFTYEGEEVSYRGTGGPTCLTCPLLRQQV